MKKIHTHISLLLVCLFVLYTPMGYVFAADNGISFGVKYLIGPGDVLEISVWKNEALTKKVTVLPDGIISYPLIGEIRAEGKTVVKLRNEIISKIKRFVPDPDILVAVLQVNSVFVYVIGRVNRPGRLVLNSNINVMQALAMAGGLNKFADQNNIKIHRKTNGHTQILSFHYDDVFSGELLHENIMLNRGDVIVVP